jgi:hypothetical protein
MHDRYACAEDVGVDNTLTTFVVDCSDTQPGEELALIGCVCVIV